MDEKDNEAIQEQKIDTLLREFGEHRNAIKDMIIDLEKIRVKVDTILPENIDRRYGNMFEEKVKSITALFNSLLDMRKEIGKSLKDEIEIRRRIKINDSVFNADDLLDVRQLSEKLEEFQKETKKHKVHKMPSLKEQAVSQDIDIPGITTRVKEQS